MNRKEQDARNRIIKAAAEILGEGTGVDRITVRQIAGRAKVGTGLINYHFKTKENLLSQAIGDIMSKMAAGFITPGGHPEQEPVARLKAMLRELYRFGERYEKLLQFSLTHGLLNGDMQTALFLVPVLREIFGGRKDEMQLRIIALQILLPIQVTGICPSAFHLFSGIDLHNREQRDKYIDTLVDNLVKQ